MNAIPVRNIDDSGPCPTAAKSVPCLHIASLIAHVRQEFIDAVAIWLEQQPRVDIHAQSSEGKFAVVMECNHEQEVLTLLDALGQHRAFLIPP